jgi:DNA-binding protein
MAKRGIPLAAIERIVKSADADIRIADSAKEELREELERLAVAIAEKACRLAEHAGRKTVKEEDIILAAED